VEGIRYKVREIEWWNLKAFSLEQIMSVSPIQVEDVVDVSKVRDTLDVARKLYAANGYSQVVIVPQFRIPETGPLVTVIFTVAEGARSR
jgi:outer membrane protein assembly factor BamA